MPSRWRQSRGCRAGEYKAGVDVFAARQVVRDDHVVAPEVGQEHLAQIDFKLAAADWSIEHLRQGHIGPTQAHRQRGRLAAAVRIARPLPLESSAAAVAECYARRRLCFVDEH